MVTSHDNRLLSDPLIDIEAQLFAPHLFFFFFYSKEFSQVHAKGFFTTSLILKYASKLLIFHTP